MPPRVPALQTSMAPSLGVRKGFVYERVPHVNLKSIANNEEIGAIHERFAERITALVRALEKLSKGRGKAEAEMEEWQIPREAEPGWSAELADTREKLLRLGRERQAEIDASIARRADTELLIDRPYQDGKRIRVTGPFTVESHGDEVLKVFGDDGERS